MNAAALLLAAASLSVDYGWRKAEDGTIEYIIQVAPDRLGDLERLPISSELPPEAREARRVVFQVGDKPLPREKFESQKPAAADSAKKSSKPEKLSVENDEPIVRGQSAADPYGSSAISDKYRGIQAGNARSAGRANSPTARVARQQEYADSTPVQAPLRPIQRPFTGGNVAEQGGANYAPANGVAQNGAGQFDENDGYGAIDDTRVARDGFRGGTPTLDLPERRNSFDSDLAEADRVSGAGVTANRNSTFTSNTSKRSGSSMQASYDQDVEERPASSRREKWSEAEADEKTTSRGAPSPWTITMMLLFASVGGNVWLGYLVWDLTQRFRDVVSDNRRRRRQTEAVDGASL